VNDIPGLTLPGMLDVAPHDDAKLLAELWPLNAHALRFLQRRYFGQKILWSSGRRTPPLLRAFRRSMLRYAADLNGKIKDISWAEFEAKTKFFVETRSSRRWMSLMRQ